MPTWKNFIIGEDKYDLSHLDYQTFTVSKPKTDSAPEKEVSFFMSFSDHCFTDHFGPSDSWIYPHAKSKTDRYFCPIRYGHSKHLPAIIPDIINQNPFVGRTFLEHREQFFHIDLNRLDVTYRIFFEISKNQSPVASTYLRINILSAYEPRREQEMKPIPRNGSFKMWHIIDARLSGFKLPNKKQR